MQITVNGESRQVAAGTTIGALLDLLEIPRDRVAVELNRDIIPKAQHPTHTLHDGDCLEIVHFVGGG